MPGRLVGDPYRSRGEAWTWLPRTPPDLTSQAVCPPASRRSSLKSSTTSSSPTHPRPSPGVRRLAQGRDPTAGSRPARRARRQYQPTGGVPWACLPPSYSRPGSCCSPATPQPGLSPAGINSVVHSLWMTGQRRTQPVTQPHAALLSTASIRSPRRAVTGCCVRPDGCRRTGATSVSVRDSDDAAARLGQQAITAAYGGTERMAVAFRLALILDGLARHLRDLAALRGGHRRCRSGPRLSCRSARDCPERRGCGVE